MALRCHIVGSKAEGNEATVSNSAKRVSGCDDVASLVFAPVTGAYPAICGVRTTPIEASSEPIASMVVDVVLPGARAVRLLGGVVPGA